MSRRSKVLLIITIIVLIIMAVVIYLMKSRGATAPVDTTPVLPSEGAPGTPPGNVPAAVPITVSTPFATAEATARSFVERWGSFSTESDYQNVADLYPLMTTSMRSWADSYVRDQRKNQTLGEFFGVTTRAMKTETLEDKAGTVKIEVTTQRVETKGILAPRSYYQTMDVSLIKNGDSYLVDGAWWK